MGEVGWVGLRGPDVLTAETLSPVDPALLLWLLGLALELCFIVKAHYIMAKAMPTDGITECTNMKEHNVTPIMVSVPIVKGYDWGELALTMCFYGFKSRLVLGPVKNGSGHCLYSTAHELGTMIHKWSAWCQYNVTRWFSMWDYDMLSM